MAGRKQGASNARYISIRPTLGAWPGDCRYNEDGEGHPGRGRGTPRRTIAEVQRGNEPACKRQPSQPEGKDGSRHRTKENWGKLSRNFTSNVANLPFKYYSEDFLLNIKRYVYHLLLLSLLFHFLRNVSVNLM